jgi:hypothetical protein
LESVFVEYSYTPDIWKIKTINSALDVTTVYTKSASSSEFLRSPILVGNYCFWHDSTNTIYYSIRNGNEWSTATVLETGSDLYGFIEDNQLFMCWTNGTRTNFRFAKTGKKLKTCFLKTFKNNKINSILLKTN